MQCKDISDIIILQFLKKQDRWCTYGPVNDWKESPMPTVALSMPNNTPMKLQLAKMKQLIKRGLVQGCTCGCRGDFEITDKGREYLKNNTMDTLERTDIYFKESGFNYLEEGDSWAFNDGVWQFKDLEWVFGTSIAQHLRNYSNTVIKN